MELGERLRKARVEAGLSQRQLCGDVITRNMLSQIENGSARPSMDTLRYLADRLGKPMGWFLEEDAVISVNQSVMASARIAFGMGQWKQVLELLEGYRGPDDTFDGERYLMSALSCIHLAGQMLEQGRTDYGWELLQQGQAAGEKTPYYTRDHERRRLALCYQARPELAESLARALPEDAAILLAAAGQKDPAQMGKILDAFPSEDRRWYTLRGDAWFAQKEYAKAAQAYGQVCPNKELLRKQEICYRELGDYKRAYECAIMQKEG